MMVSTAVSRLASKRRALALLAAGTALTLVAQAASAAEASPDAAEQAHEAVADRGTIRVVGHPDPEGLLPDQSAPKAISAVSSAFIEKQAPTFNAFQLVNLLPGANVSMSDPFGLSTSSSLTLRGLGQDEIGVLMEGAPRTTSAIITPIPRNSPMPRM
jgi:iron complex outermembrane receptor protein